MLLSYTRFQAPQGQSCSSFLCVTFLSSSYWALYIVAAYRSLLHGWMLRCLDGRVDGWFILADFREAGWWCICHTTVHGLMISCISSLCNLEQVVYVLCASEKWKKHT